MSIHGRIPRGWVRCSHCDGPFRVDSLRHHLPKCRGPTYSNSNNNINNNNNNHYNSNVNSNINFSNGYNRYDGYNSNNEDTFEWTSDESFSQGNRNGCHEKKKSGMFFEDLNHDDFMPKKSRNRYASSFHNSRYRYDNNNSNNNSSSNDSNSNKESNNYDGYISPPRSLNEEAARYKASDFLDEGFYENPFNKNNNNSSNRSSSGIPLTPEKEEEYGFHSDSFGQNSGFDYYDFDFDDYMRKFQRKNDDHNKYNDKYKYSKSKSYRYGNGNKSYHNSSKNTSSSGDSNNFRDNSNSNTRNRNGDSSTNSKANDANANTRSKSSNHKNYRPNTNSNDAKSSHSTGNSSSNKGRYNNHDDINNFTNESNITDSAETFKRLESQWKAFETHLASTSVIRFGDIPFPNAEGKDPFGMAHIGDLNERRKVVRRLLLRWHPDKFQQRIGGSICDSDAEKIKEKVSNIAQILTKMSS